MRKLNLLSTCIALALTTQVTIAAEIDLLNLDSRSVGDTSLGDHVIVSQDTDTSAKYITGNDGAVGQMLAPINMPSGSEVRMKVKLYLADLKLSLLADEYQIALSLEGTSTSLSGNALTKSASDIGHAWVSGGHNVIKLALIGSEVKVYINDVFSQKATLVNPNLAFNQLKLNGIKPTTRYDGYVAIYELKAGGNVTTAASCPSGSSTTTTPISGTTNTGDLPQISSNLDIKIPRGLYSQSGGLFTPAGSIPVWADLKYNAGGNYWTLSGAGVLPQ